MMIIRTCTQAETAAVEDGDSTTGAPSTVGDKQQQLSPVSVLDFAFDDNDGEEEGSDAGTSCSCSSPAFQFQRCTPPAVDLHGKLASEQLRSLPSISLCCTLFVDPQLLLLPRFFITSRFI